MPPSDRRVIRVSAPFPFVPDNAEKLEQMRITVDEKLQGTLEQRLGASFKLVSDQLEQVFRGVGEMQTARNRGLVDDATFAQAIREGHTKTKYTGLADALRHPVLSAVQYSTLFLKGWIDKGARDKGGALTGYTTEQMDLLYLAQGRPAAPGQMATAACRGIDGPKGRPVDREQFLDAIKQSDIRPEYGPMLWDTRFLYPPLFQISRLVAAGDIDPATGAEWSRGPAGRIRPAHRRRTQGRRDRRWSFLSSSRGRRRRGRRWSDCRRRRGGGGRVAGRRNGRAAAAHTFRAD